MQQWILVGTCLILMVACSAPPVPTATPNTSAILTVTAPRSATNASSGPASSANANATPVSPPAHATLVAHRGGAGLAPENTLGAFQNAIKLGADMVECDVHLSKDGELVVMHDPNVSRTTDGSGQIGELTLAEIKKLNAAAKFTGSGSWSPQAVPTMGEVLDTIKGKIAIQIEIKLTAANQRYPGIEKKLVDAIHARGMIDQVIVISFDFATIKDVKALDPSIKTGAIVNASWFAGRSNMDAIVNEIAATGADYFMPTSGSVSEAMIKAFHARGFKMGTWTVNTAPEMQRLAGWGIDAITSDRPDELVKTLGKGQ